MKSRIVKIAELTLAIMASTYLAEKVKEQIAKARA
jgi:hypothetical protein